MIFLCSSCGQEHDLEQISLGAPAPHLWTMLTPAELQASELREELCVVRAATGTTHHFVRGCLLLPIKDSDRTFTWGVWVSLSERGYIDILAHWKDPQRATLPAQTGWLNSRLPDYPETLNQKVSVRQRDVGLRPLIELEASSPHPLAVQQREGIAEAELRQIVERALHA